MTPAEWFDLMEENAEHVAEQIKTCLPEVDFTSIKVGLPPIVYLQQQQGRVEVTVNAVKLDLDDRGNLNKVKILTLSP